MKITLLGTGGPKPDPKRQGPAVLIEVAGKKLLFDAGRSCTHQLAQCGLSSKDLDALFISHHHFDHISDLGDLLLSGWNLGRREPLPIKGPEGMEDIIDALFTRVYQRDIAFRLNEAKQSGIALAPIENVFAGQDISAGLIYDTDGVQVFCAPIRHGKATNDDWHCLCYRIEYAGKIIAISGDGVCCDGLISMAQNADILVQCTYLNDEESQSAEGQLVSEHILANSSGAGQIAQKANVKKVILTHLRQKTTQELGRAVQETQQYFDGEVILGEDLMTINI